MICVTAPTSLGTTAITTCCLFPVREGVFHSAITRFHQDCCLRVVFKFLRVEARCDAFICFPRCVACAKLGSTCICVREQTVAKFRKAPSSRQHSRTRFLLTRAKTDARLCWSFLHIHFHARSSSQENRAGSSLKRAQNTSWLLPITNSYAGSTLSTGLRKVGDKVAPPRPWTSSGLSFCCNQQDLPRRLFLEHSGHMA